MSRGQFALVGAVLGAIAVGVFIIAFEANVALGGGSDIKQHARGIFMLVGAGAGFLLFGLFGGPRKPPSKPPDTTP
jgi:multisubunit Na+/H+ antiporter MnhB subunit